MQQIFEPIMIRRTTHNTQLCTYPEVARSHNRLYTNHTNLLGAEAPTLKRIWLSSEAGDRTSWSAGDDSRLFERASSSCVYFIRMTMSVSYVSASLTMLKTGLRDNLGFGWSRGYAKACWYVSTLLVVRRLSNFARFCF
jgi:hypothetical protein